MKNIDVARRARTSSSILLSLAATLTASTALASDPMPACSDAGGSSLTINTSGRNGFGWFISGWSAPSVTCSVSNVARPVDITANGGSGVSGEVPGDGGRAGDVTLDLGGTMSGDHFVGVTTIGGSGGNADQGYNGHNGGYGDAGGNVTIRNSAVATLSTGGIWVFTAGGTGGYTNGEHAEGGAGGASGSVNIANHGSLTVEAGTGIGVNLISGHGGDYIPDDDKLGKAGHADDTGFVTITNENLIVTGGTAANSFGIYVASRAGDAGNVDAGYSNKAGNTGGISITNNGTVETSGEASDAVHIEAQAGKGTDVKYKSGNGGNPGITGDVAVSNNGRLISHGEYAAGIVIETRAGNGGKGGDGGGQGVGGGSNGQITVENTGTIKTQGTFATGVFAGSIAGDGEAGGNDHGHHAVGGNGGNGGHGGTISLTESGNASIVTTGDLSVGAHLLSVGGDGGRGGDASASGLFTAVAIGGNGGNGGSGGAVNVKLSDNASIATTGDLSSALLIESIGGGGGMGGSAKAKAIFSAIAVGGTGGQGGDGGNVSVDLEGKSSISATGDHSAGILIHTIGGGGGVGGQAKASTIGPGLSASIAIGGDGGGGGQGGQVNLTIGKGTSVITGTEQPLANIDTDQNRGSNSPGILVQTVGGGGGQGGTALTQSLTVNPVASMSLSVAIGGSGGRGGAGGNIYGVMDGTVITHASNSAGMLMQSIGGGGGSGGAATSLSGSIGGEFSASLGLTMGGSGGSGGSAQSVNLSGAGSIVTEGDNSGGILMQSIAGGGGNGGRSTNLGFSAGGTSISASATIGGSGGTGGNAGTVTMDYTGGVETSGANSTGVLLQSIGGGGGNGGSAINATASFGGDAAINASAAIGGTGGGGGTGGIIEVHRYDAGSLGTILTHGDNSSGLVAQSIGGGGGNGGTAVDVGVTATKNSSYNANISIGGGAGAGGTGQRVTIAPTAGSITTTGNLSSGIIAQSIGGGGGNGGAAVTVTADLQSAVAGTSNVSLGGGVSFAGFGGSGGRGGTVEVDSGVAITTSGSGSLGIIAQSISGGGGNGGAAVSASATVSKNSQNTYSADVALGGQGGWGATGGSVTVTNRSVIETDGDHSIGILAQSVGGGGGNGGSATTASLTYSSTELSASQVSTTISGDVALGGKGGVGGSGGMVNVSNLQTTTTKGDHASAIVAQSVGGGGGNGGASRVISVTTSKAGSTDQDLPGQSQTSSTDVSLGGNGGTGGLGGAVSLTNSGLLYTAGSHSAGMLAQSVGGGGGNGGSSLLLSYTKGSRLGDSDRTALTVKGRELAVGGSGGSGNNGGAVTGTNTGTIGTSGDASVGALLQSIGGGGGNGGVVTEYDKISKEESKNRKAVIGGSGGDGGDGSNVKFTDQQGSMNTVILTKGARSAGIVMQSIGGGGGNTGAVQNIRLPGSSNGDDSSANDKTMTDIVDRVIGATDSGTGGIAGFVTLDEYGHVWTFGENAHGIVAQAIGGGGGTFSDVKTYQLQDAINAFKSGDSKSSSPTDSLANSGTYQLGVTGGASGGAYDVNVTLHDGSAVATTGGLSSGIVAQAISGGGGDVGVVSTDDAGGLDISEYGLTTAYGANTHDISAVLGARQNSGLYGTGIVAVDLQGNTSITTRGAGARGIVAQSIGSGGGLFSVDNSSSLMASSIPTATYSFVLAGMGDLFSRNASGGFADGNEIGYSGHVQVGLATNSVISTSGSFSHGILAQSIGSGGGSAGVVYGKDIEIDSQKVDTYLGVDSTSSTDGFSNIRKGWANQVTVTNNGLVSTAGNQAIGVLAQSIGGGGGEVFYQVADGQTAAINVEFATHGLSQARADAVHVDQNGRITTAGDLSHGIVAQSVSGGGGLLTVGDLDAVAGGTVTATFGNRNSDSVGYGSANVALTGGSINTTGNMAFGVLAQKVDGGGGILSIDGGKTITPEIVLNRGTVMGGSAVNVSMDAVSRIMTSGMASHGIFAQVAAGGGGLALLNGTAGFTTNAYDLSKYGTGGAITIEADGAITTSGVGANAIFATSPSGPSIVVQKDADLSILGYSRAGNGGHINVTQASTGNIAVSGAGSAGIYAVSKGRDARVIDVNVYGTVSASGENGAGILTRNTNAFDETGQTDISDSDATITTRVLVASGGKVLARDERTATDAIHIINGLGSYELVIDGRVAAVAADGSKAQTFGGKDNAVWAAGKGTVQIETTGGVEGTMRFTGNTVVNNYGIMDGAVYGAADYVLAGVYDGHPMGGKHYFEVRPGQDAAASVDADKIALGQGSQLHPYLGDFGSLTAPVALLSSSQAISDFGTLILNTPVLTFDHHWTSNALYLDQVKANFANVVGLSANASAIAKTVDPLVQGWMKGGTVAADDVQLHDLLLNAANQETSSGLDKLLGDNADSSKHYGVATSQHTAAISHIDNIHSCGTEYGVYAAINESECTWLKATERYSEDFSSNTISRAFGIDAGKQVAIADDWRFGVGFGYDTTSLRGDTLTGDGQGLHAGAVLKYSSGGWLATAAISGSYTWGDGKRSIPILGLTANSSQEAYGVSGRLRLAREFDFGSFFAIPTVDLDMSWIRDLGYTERGAGSLDLKVYSNNAMLFDLHPQIQVGTQFVLDDGWLMRPYLEAGALFALNDQNITQSFATGSLSSAKHSVVLDREDVKATVAAGLTMFQGEGFQVKLRYEGTFGEESRSHVGSIKIGMKF